jgi:uncharacterized protein YqeY
MVLKERIEADLKTALKSGDGVRVSVVRMVKAAITSKEIELKVKSLDDQGVIAVLNTLVKRANESIEQFEKGGRSDLVGKEKAELAVLKQYLPEQMSEADVEKLVIDAIKESGALGAKDMGKVMKVLMPKVAGRADGKMVGALVQKKLQG